jgi:hypothetical protein
MVDVQWATCGKCGGQYWIKALEDHERQCKGRPTKVYLAMSNVSRGVK